MTRIRAIILDFDGVLLESEEAKTHAFADTFSRHPAYREAMMAYHLMHRSLPRRVKFEDCVSVLMGQPDNQELVDEMARHFSECVIRWVQACPEVPGAREFLAEFSAAVPLYVASVTPQEELRQVLRVRGLEPFIVEAFGDPPCPKAEAIRRVLSREGLRPDEIAFIGDSPSDYRAAVEAGLRFIGRDSGLSFDGCPAVVYRDLHEIAAVLRPQVGLAS